MKVQDFHKLFMLAMVLLMLAACSGTSPQKQPAKQAPTASSQESKQQALLEEAQIKELKDDLTFDTGKAKDHNDPEFLTAQEDGFAYGFVDFFAPTLAYVEVRGIIADRKVTELRGFTTDKPTVEIKIMPGEFHIFYKCPHKDVPKCEQSVREGLITAKITLP
jgi:hypothetical protein